MFELMKDRYYRVIKGLSNNNKHQSVCFTRTWDFEWRMSDCEELVGVTWRLSDCEELVGVTQKRWWRWIKEELQS